MRLVFALLDSPLMLLFLGALAVLLFGERLPEVARSFGKSLAELRKGMRGIQDEIRSAIDSAASSDSSPAAPKDPYGGSYVDVGSVRCEEPEDREEPTSPKFEPPGA
jgi:sec-independent protein translocase protein TatA